MKRREFFGVTAAATTVVVTPLVLGQGGRTFARTLERPEFDSTKNIETGETLTDAVMILYNNGVRVYSKKVALTVTHHKGNVQFGSNASIVLDDFVGSTDDLGIEINFVGLPIERMIGYGGVSLPVVITKGNTLTLEASHTGFLEIS